VTLYSSSEAVSPLFLLCFLAYLWFLKNLGSIYSYCQRETIQTNKNHIFFCIKCELFETTLSQLNKERKTHNRRRGEYPFGGSVAMPLWLFDAILVGLVGLVVSGVVLRLCHLCNSMKNKLHNEERT